MFVALVLSANLSVPAAGDAIERTRGSDTTGEWSEFRGNLNNTGYSLSTVPATNRTFLELPITFQIRSSATAWGDVIYFGTDFGFVYAVNISTGMEVWNHSTTGEVWATPLVTEDHVYVGSTDDHFFALDRHNGTPIWTNQTSGDIKGSAKIHDGKIVFASGDGNLYFLDPLTGSEIMPPFQTGGEILGTPAIVADTAIIGSNDGRVYRVSLADGSETWNFTTNPAFPGEVKYTSAAVSGNSVVIGSNDYNFYCIDLDTGSLVWEFATGSLVYASPAIHNGVAFLHSLNGNLSAVPLDDPNGDGTITENEIIWTFQTRDSNGGIEGGSSPAVADGKVVVGSRLSFLEGYLFVVDEQEGDLVWSLRIPGTYSSPMVVDGKIFIGSAGGFMWGISERAPGMTLEIVPEFMELESERLMVIEFFVTYAGEPVEGAFINFEVTDGVLSQSGASTLADGIQRVKYLSPVVTDNTTVTVRGWANKYGMEEARASLDIVITPAEDYGTTSGEVFSWDKYMPFVIAIIILAVLNILILTAVSLRRRSSE